jgi:DNA-binding CsgD family transcriptional regulator
MAAVLTPREIEVLTLIRDGQTYRQVAHVLGISVQTVKNHVSHVLEKFEVGNNVAAVVLAIRDGYVDLGDEPSRRRVSIAAVVETQDLLMEMMTEYGHRIGDLLEVSLVPEGTGSGRVLKIDGREV